MKEISRSNLELFLVYLSLLIPLGLLFNILPLERNLIFIGLALLALYLERKNVYFPRFVINVLGLFFILLFFLTVTWVNFLEKSLETLLFLLSLKLLEKKSLRDYFQIYLLELLLLAGEANFYVNFSFFFLLCFQLSFIIYALFFHLYVKESPSFFISLKEIKSILFWIGLLQFFSYLLGSLFFLFFPRLSSPLFNIGIKEEKKAKSGFTENIRLGSFSEIQESSKRIFRVVFKEKIKIRPENLYFRVIIYDFFDGKTWSRKYLPEEVLINRYSPLIPKEEGQHLKATFYLEADLEGYLPVLDGTIRVKGLDKVKAFKDGVYRIEDFPIYPLKYELSFRRSEFSSEVFKGEDLKIYLQVPEVNPKILKLAETFKGRNPQETIEKILDYYQKEGFRYSLKELPLGEDPLELFLFKTKKGNCEYFASATALFLRLNGIPSRVVGGFRGAIYHQLGDYYLVQENFAHSWVEVWIEDRWTRLEPSPQANFLLVEKKTFFNQLKLYLDWLNFLYNRYFLDYNKNTQKKLLEFLKGSFLRKGLYWDKLKGEGYDQKRDYKIVFFLVLMLLLFLIFYFLVRERKNLFSSKEKKLLKSFLKELSKRGYPRKENEGLFEVAEKIEDVRFKEEVLRFIKLYYERRYKDKNFEEETLKELRLCLKRLQNWR